MTTSTTTLPANKAAKVNKIIYWVATIWLALGMASTGVVQLIKMDSEVTMMNELGYPVYFLTIIGIAKMLGVLAILVPKFPILKEWAYAGFFFLMSGAVISHLIIADEPKSIFGPALLLVLTLVSWHFRPADRKSVSVNR
jgi:hypothetical protein